jgi:hypothetical protein
MKTCSKCKQVKDYTQFSIENTRKDGLRRICKDCDNLARKRRGKKTYKKYGRKRKKDPLARVKAWCSSMVKRHKRNGTLVVQPCEVCGSTFKIEAHHDNYFLPLQINWLCATHHRRRHCELNVIAKTQGKECHPFFQVPEQVGKNTLQGKLL